jgi:hypothetical protein
LSALKVESSCRVERLHLATAERLQRALAIYGGVAWQLLWLTREARQDEEVAGMQILMHHEWQALACTIHQTPHLPPTLRQAVRWIA